MFSIGLIYRRRRRRDDATYGNYESTNYPNTTDRLTDSRGN